MKKIFEAKVIQVGPEAQNMIQDANMLILFGEEAPGDLAEYCFKIDNKKSARFNTRRRQAGGR